MEAIDRRLRESSVAESRRSDYYRESWANLPGCSRFRCRRKGFRPGRCSRPTLVRSEIASRHRTNGLERGPQYDEEFTGKPSARFRVIRHGRTGTVQRLLL